MFVCEHMNEEQQERSRLVDDGSDKSQEQISPMKQVEMGEDEISLTNTKNQRGPAAKTNGTVRATKDPKPPENPSGFSFRLF